MEKKIHTELTLLDNSYHFINESINYYSRAKRTPKCWSFAVFCNNTRNRIIIKTRFKT